MELNEEKISQAELMDLAKKNDAFSGLSDKELYAMIVMDTSTCAIRTVKEHLAKSNMKAESEDLDFVLSEAIRLIEELSALDFHGDFKRDCVEIIKGKRMK